MNKGRCWFETLAIVCEKTCASLFVGTSLHFHKSNVSYMHVFYFCFRFNIFMISRILGILLYLKTVKFFSQLISAHKQTKLGRSRLSSFLAFLIATMGKNVEVAMSLMTGTGLEPTMTYFANKHSTIYLTIGQFD